MALTKLLTPPRKFKPNYDEMVRRWEAYFAGDLLDRPIVMLTAPLPGKSAPPNLVYREYQSASYDEVVERWLRKAEANYYAGESFPEFCVTYGCDEVAVFCGGGAFKFHAISNDTVWTEPVVNDWESFLPFGLHEAHPLWQRLLPLYRYGAERVAGKLAIGNLDLHTNMDMLMALRGSQQLCIDCIDTPEVIDRAMACARAVFPRVWYGVAEAGRRDELGYAANFYSETPAAVLQCDFSCMISPEMFRRWAMPALEEEAAIVQRVYYHWDGVGALIHSNDILAMPGLHTLGFLPGEGKGSHLDYVELYRQWQQAGKSVHVGGSFEQIKRLHRELDPAKTMYSTGAGTPDEAEQMLAWFVKNT